jgi:hypothetical protein
MNTLLEPAKQIVRDLVDRKLWPVAVLLLAAIVAVPLLIGGSSAGGGAAPVALSTDAPEGPGSKSLVTVVDQAATEEARPGRIEDPFYDPPAAPADEAAAQGSTSTAAVSSDARATSAGGTPAADEAPATTTTQRATTTPRPAEPAVAPVYHRTAVRWYATTRGKPRPLSRLTPLGGLADPAAMYLGVTKSNGSYAVFLLGPNATSAGQAACEDSACRVIGLKAGETQVVRVQPAGGGPVRQYFLEVVKVTKVTTDAATARTMRLRVHRDGRDVMRKLWQDVPTADALRPIRFDPDAGLLVKQAATAPDKAAQ